MLFISFSRLFKAALAIAVVVSLSPLARAQKFEDLAKTPQMGWNSWNTFGCNIDEKLIRDIADQMVASGMKDAGYEYVNIDDCWHGKRDEAGNIQAHPERFPSGIKALADYVHAKGLKLGIYSDAGNKTCAGYPGSRGHEYQDAKTYASWGIDYVKYDWCDTKGLNAAGAYTTFRDALYATGRPILFSICEWGDNKPAEWAPAIGHSWRTTGDIYPCWDCEFSHGSWASLGVLKILDKQQGLRIYAGPGHWNDMDMMEVGNGMSESEDRAHFSLWAMLTSPLIAGNDIRSMSKATQKILTNKAVIAINQDPLGIQAMRAMSDGKIEMFVKPLANEEWAVLFLNRSDVAITHTFKWAENNIEDDFSHKYLKFSETQYAWVDLWSGEKGSTAKNYSENIPAHAVRMYRLTPIK